MSKPPRSNYPDIGHLGEDLVAQWLQSTGWEVLHRRFYSRWGEIDIIAQYHQHIETATSQNTNNPDSILAFVEVKTRSAGNWDAGGKTAITPQKQAKLWRTAEMFLAEYPQMANYSCRFDVAIVFCQRVLNKPSQVTAISEAIASLSTNELTLQLQEYIPAAFEL